MQAARALVEPVQSLLHRIGVEGGHFGHIALLQAHTLAVFEVNGRDQQHDRSELLGVAG